MSAEYLKHTISYTLTGKSGATLAHVHINIKMNANRTPKSILSLAEHLLQFSIIKNSKLNKPPRAATVETMLSALRTLPHKRILSIKKHHFIVKFFSRILNCQLCVYVPSIIKTPKSNPLSTHYHRIQLTYNFSHFLI